MQDEKPKSVDQVPCGGLIAAAIRVVAISTWPSAHGHQHMAISTWPSAHAPLKRTPRGLKAEDDLEYDD
jgi:hypothetical protein